MARISASLVKRSRLLFRTRLANEHRSARIWGRMTGVINIPGARIEPSEVVPCPIAIDSFVKRFVLAVTILRKMYDSASRNCAPNLLSCRRNAGRGWPVSLGIREWNFRGPPGSFAIVMKKVTFAGTGGYYGFYLNTVH